MRKKVILGIFILILLLSVFIPTTSLAITSSGGYSIESYDIKMIVNENNTFDITETIGVNFYGRDKHGIFRKIPTQNTVKRLDGTKSNNTAKISNVTVNDSYTMLVEKGYKVLKIGSSSQKVSGEKIYVIKYNYNIGKDPLKNSDELYFNLIGDEWDTSIENVTFTIIMPKTFDKSKLGFSNGSEYSTYNSNVNYTVSGDTIQGSLETALSSGQSLTVRLELPEGYFSGASSNVDFLTLFGIAISIIFVIIAFILWIKYGKSEATIETIEFYPPEGMNSAELGFIYKGYSQSHDVISLLIHLANKGYLKIEEFEKQKLKAKSFKIIKIKEYDGNNENERIFFNDLFASKDEVTKSDLYDKFYLTLKKISENINRKENKKIFEKTSLSQKIFLSLMIIVIFLFIVVRAVLSNVEMGYELIIPSLLIACFTFASGLILLFRNTYVFYPLVSWSAVVASFYCAVPAIFLDSTQLIEFIIENICMVLLIRFLGTMKKRTKYGTEMLGKIQGFKYFLETVKKPQLEELVMHNPEYFYDILPYTYVLGVSDKWMKKFEDIALEAPKWYSGYTTFDNHSFKRFMNSTYSSISATTSSSASGGGSSGGGSSGGGSGGGGGGSW